MLAIVIPYYKITYFENNLRSLANQSNKKFTVYVGNDSSPENPDNLIANFQNQLNLIYHKFENNLGSKSLTQQWQRCIELSKNEDWIMILGDDDFLGENVVEQFYNKFIEIETSKSNVVRFTSQLVYPEENKKSKVFEHPKFESVENAYFNKFTKKSRSSLSEYIFKKSAYQKFGFINYPMAWHSDDHAWLDFSENKPIYSINNAIVFITVSINSISGNKQDWNDKNVAEKSFFYFLITQKWANFNKAQRQKLLYQTELSFLNIKKLTNKECLFFLKKYLKNRQLLPFLKYLRRLFLSYFNKD